MFGSYEVEQLEASEASRTIALLRIIAILIGGAIVVALCVYVTY